MLERQIAGVAQQPTTLRPFLLQCPHVLLVAFALRQIGGRRDSDYHHRHVPIAESRHRLSGAPGSVARVACGEGDRQSDGVAEAPESGRANDCVLPATWARTMKAGGCQKIRFLVEGVDKNRAELERVVRTLAVERVVVNESRRQDEPNVLLAGDLQ